MRSFKSMAPNIFLLPYIIYRNILFPNVSFLISSSKSPKNEEGGTSNLLTPSLTIPMDTGTGGLKIKKTLKILT